MLIKLLNSIYYINCLPKKAFIAALSLMMLIASGCGKRTPPLPPVERVEQRAAITGFQQGNTVNLSWTMPAGNASGADVLNIDRAEIYRLVEPVDSSLTLTEDEFASRSTLIDSIKIQPTDFARKQLNYRDSLDFARQTARLRYAVRFVNATGQKAAFSNFLLIEPSAKIAAAAYISETKVSKDAVFLVWNAPETNIDNSMPVNLLGYNVYRKSSGGEAFKLLNNQPVTKNQFSDGFFEFGKQYVYMVRAVSIGANGEPIETLDSNSVAVAPKDIFAPSAPSALTIAAAPNTLSLFFATNPERDIAGYRIYRTLDPNVQKSEWRLLNRELSSKNTFQDKTVESGKTYYYFLTAVDKTGNVGEPSEVVSETAP